MPPVISPDKLCQYCARTYCLPPAPRITSPEAALDYVNARGFIYFWPIKGVDLPSLWTAVAGDRPVADAHDDPGHITWGWKDAALGKRIWYYAKVLRRKATLISLADAPYFYALSENYGAPEEDYLLAYQSGRLTQAAKQVYEALLKEGRLNTLDLRKAARLTSQEGESAFNRALEVLQADFKILPVGVAQAGAWRYSFIYEITAYHMPNLPEQARAIGEAEARAHLLLRYLRSVGAAQPRDVTRLFGWPPELAARALRRLVDDGLIVAGAVHPTQKGAWFALPDVLD